MKCHSSIPANFPVNAIALCMAFLLLLAIWGLHAAEKLRLEDVVYLDDFMDKSVELKAVKTTPLTFSRDGNSVIDSIRAKQSVRLIGIGPERYLVQARVTNGRAEGWVLPGDMEPIPEAILKELQKKSADADRIRQAIARGEIEMGMSEEDVIRILGTPKARSQVKDSRGSSDQWTYTSYKKVPFYVNSMINGTNYVSTLFRNVPVGSKIVSFQEKKVVRFETKQDDTTQQQQGGVVIPPGFVQ